MNDRFPSTRRSLIFAARQPELRGEAIAAIADVYWKPAYKYIRLHWRKSAEDAQDLTQDFFASALLDRDLLSRWDPARASFRTYLRLCIDGQVKNGLTAAARLKRGGGSKPPLSLEEYASAESELANVHAASAEEIFHREWQRRIFELAIDDLRLACDEGGRQLQFQLFEEYDLKGEPRPSYAELAAKHSIAVTTVTNHLAWARRELRRFAAERIAGASSGEEEARRDLRELFSPKAPKS